MRTKKVLSPEGLAKEEWRLISDIGWDASKLQSILPSIKDRRNLDEVTWMLKRLASQKTTNDKSTAKAITSTSTLITQDGLIKVVDNGSNINYKIGKFSYLVEDCTVIVTKDSGTSIINIACYTYKSDPQALDAGYKMAKRQETVEREILNQQKQAVKNSLAVSKKQSVKTVRVKAN